MCQGEPLLSSSPEKKKAKVSVDSLSAVPTVPSDETSMSFKNVKEKFVDPKEPPLPWISLTELSKVRDASSRNIKLIITAIIKKLPKKKNKNKSLMIAVTVSDGTGAARNAVLSEELVLDFLGGLEQEEFIRLWKDNREALAKPYEKMCQDVVAGIEGIFEARWGDPFYANEHGTSMTLLKYRRVDTSDTRKMVKYMQWKHAYGTSHEQMVPADVIQL